MLRLILLKRYYCSCDGTKVPGVLWGNDVPALKGRAIQHNNPFEKYCVVVKALKSREFYGEMMSMP
jgi:hypothetical protein